MKISLTPIQYYSLSLQESVIADISPIGVMPRERYFNNWVCEFLFREI